MKKIYIEGMSCNHCVNHVKEALEEINEKDIKVNLEEKFATVQGVNDDETLKEAIEDAGYDVTKITNE